MRVIMAGGGTGGHIYPALTIAKEIIRKRPDAEILFIGGKRGLEAKIIPKEGFRLITLDLEGIPRQISLKVFRSIGLAARGVWQTFRIVKEFRPNLVVGTGGYVCGPVVLAAALMGIPCAIQEQNAFPGLTNRTLGRFVDRIFLAYPEAERFFRKSKIRVYGNPIRSAEFAGAVRAKAESALGLAPNHTNLFVFGGSQSARKINQTLLAIVSDLLREFPKLQIVMMTGLKDHQAVEQQVAKMKLSPELRNRLFLMAYFYKIADAYKASDLVLARAGAISLAEITCFGLPALLIPFPFATNNHQEFNARVLEKRGAAKVLLESELTPESLKLALTELLKDEKNRALMARASLAMSRPQAAEDIVTELLQLAKA